MQQLTLFDEKESIEMGIRHADYILMSLKPQFYRLILAGKKKHEFRKRFPDKPINAFIYVTQPVGAVKALLELDSPIKEPEGLIGHEGIGVREFIHGQKPGRVALPIRSVRPLKRRWIWRS